jgi:hypothetical protein
VIHALDCVEESIKSDAAYRQQIEAMRRHLDFNR